MDLKRQSGIRLGREGIVVLLAFVVMTMILGAATIWLGSH
jgi:hypothetical protein